MIQIGFSRNYSSGSYDVYVQRITPTGRVPIEIRIRELPEVGPHLQAPVSVHLEWNCAELVKALLDGLQEAGLMPPMNASEAELKASLRHLDDMRALVFKQLKPREIK